MLPGNGCLKREDIESVTVRVLRPAERARPDVRLIRLDGRLCVLKDYGAKAPIFKRLLGAFLVWREGVAYQRAAGVAGVPALIGTVGRCGLITEYVESAEATSADNSFFTPEFFATLEHSITELHRKGVVHGDLKKLENVLVTPDGHPALIDFTAAFVTGSSPLSAAVFPWIVDDDMRAITKLKLRCAPHLATEEECRFLQERSAIEKAFRWFRRYVRYVVKRYSTPEHERAQIRLK
jgi:tRNA A-37 threonylcarbamoyl transferase component Bud32